jgi:PAS domain S-box-containing protein
MSEETSHEVASGNEFHGDPVSANLKPVRELVDDGRPEHNVNNANTRRMKPQTRVHPSSELRQRAEVHLRKVIEKAVPRLDNKEVKALVNELQIHQIELEVQNIDLEQARLETEDSRDRYRDLFESAPVAYCSLDQDGRIREMNRATEALLAVDRQTVRGQPFAMFVADEDVLRFTLEYRAMLKLQGPHRSDFTLRVGGVAKTVLIDACTITTGDEGPQVRLAVTDVSSLRQAELMLNETNIQKKLADANLLQTISASLIQEDNAQGLYEKILDTAMQLLQSDMASMHVLDESQHALRLLAWPGFGPEFGQVFQLCGDESKTSWGSAMRECRRVIVPDVETCAFIMGTSALEDHRKNGIRAVQSTPLISRDGQLLGIISTHWRRPHQPGERELALLDVLARQATDLLERKQAEHALRENERRFREMIDALPAAIYTTDAEGRLTHFNPAAVEFSGRKPELGTDHWCVSWKLYHADGRPMPHDECPMAVALKEGRVLRDVEAVAERPDGKRIWFTPYPTPLRDLQGKIVGGINMLVDITERKKAEKALRRNESYLRDLVEHASVGLHWVGPDGMILWANQTELDMLGYQREEYIGHHITEFHADATVIEDILARLTSGETLHEYEARLRHKNGSIRQVLISSNALFEDDKFVHTRCFTHDITERKQAERASALLATIVESSDDAIISKDLNGIILSWNNGAERLFGYTAQEAIGQPITMLIPPNRFDEEPGILKHIRHGEFIQHYETVRRRKDGALIDISLTVSPLLDKQGQIVGASKIARDITERKRTETRLTQFAAELEQRVVERTAELVQSENRLRTLAKELNLAEQRERTRLAGELHDYLAQLLVFCRMTLAQAKKTGLSLRGENFIKETEESLDKALTYCRTLMAELSPPVVQEQGLPAGLLWLCDHMKRQGLAVTVVLPEPLDLPLPKDCAVLLFQSVRELLINVAKHGVVKEATVCMTSEDRSLCIVVRDENGFDLASAAAAAAAAKTSPLSSKFGLFSIRERMKALGGRFDIQSAPGQGTTATLMLHLSSPRTPSFELRVPPSSIGSRARDSEPRTQNSQFHQHGTEGIRVLLVDDHTLLRQGLLSIVSAYNHFEIVGEAGDGVEAVELAERLRPDVIVMDIHMPRMDGIEATKRIKANRPEVIIIGLSVNESADMAQRMKAAGVTVYLTKESASDTLCRAIEAEVIQKRNSSDLPQTIQIDDLMQLGKPLGEYRSI